MSGAPTDPPANGEADSKASTAARVLFGLFIIWASFYLVALAERISDNGARKRSAPPPGQTFPRESNPIESHPQEKAAPKENAP